ncbi:MAG: flavin reductase family protein [Anaerolineales bacterium]|nr:flavin reductase family protein [Anaerolineales bacterium]
MENEIVTLDPAELADRDAYRLLISVIIPRPIAWVSSMGLDGSHNLAPYSFFNAVSGSPPTVMFSVGQRAGQPKDTLRNIQETGEFVVNMADRILADKMVKTAGEWGYGVDEFSVADLETIPSAKVKPPRVALAPIAMEAKTTQIIPIDDSANTLILGQVVCFHIRTGLLLPKGTVDAKLFNPVARLGSADYATLGEILTILRPQV